MPGAPVALAAVLVVTSCALAGCGASDTYALPEYRPGSTPPVTGGPAPVPTTTRATPAVPRVTPTPAVKYTPADAAGEGAWVEQGHIHAPSAPARAAVAAMSAYISVRAQISNTWLIDEPALDAVASGQAVTAAQDRAVTEQNRGYRSVGRVVVNVSSVRISGSTATVTGCPFDGTSELDSNGRIVIYPPGGVRLTVKLQQTGGTWRVTDWPDRPAPFCEGWK